MLGGLSESREERTGMILLRSSISLDESWARSRRCESFHGKYSGAGLGQDLSESENISFPGVNRRVSLQLSLNGRYVLLLQQIHKIPHTRRLMY